MTKTEELPTAASLSSEFRWKPNPGQQTFALSIPGNVFEVLYGGARGGGKTDAGIYWLIKPVNELAGQPLINHPMFRALVLRRNANDLTDWLDRATRVYSQYGAVLKDRHRQPFFLFPSGSKIYAGHLRDEEAYTKYQGHEYQRILIEELTQIKDELLYVKLIGSCRSTVPNLRPQVFMTTNPGGKGHGWVRRRFVVAAPWNSFFINPSTGRPAIFIPARVEDNPTLIRNDPEYITQLEALKMVDERLYRAWRNGEWDAFEGQVFSEFAYATHVFPRMMVSLSDCERIASFDWGYRSPASMHWIARTAKNRYDVQHLLIYREIYRSKLTPKQWGQLIARIQKIDPIDYLVLPHDCFASDQGQLTIAQQFEAEFKAAGVQIRIVKGATMAKGARKSRLALMHSGFAISPDGYPYIMVHESCTNFIRTIPELIYSETDIEDVDTDGEDHAYDSSSLGVMTLKPKFEGGALVELRPRKPYAFKRTWQQNESGNTQPDDIMKALGRPERQNTTSGEF